ncbi:MAG: hypothetical protein ACFHW5_13530 [Verrucomicrobiota bacterium]
MTGPQTPQGPKWVQAGACPSIVYNGGTGATPFPYLPLYLPPEQSNRNAGRPQRFDRQQLFHRTMTGPQTPQGPKWVQAGACPSIVYNGGTGATPFPYLPLYHPPEQSNRNAGRPQRFDRQQLFHRTMTGPQTPQGPKWVQAGA